MITRIKAQGTVIIDEVETYDYGKFVHISDPEGNRIELWEPVDASFTSERDSEMH
jgi:predicted enzyme related to lactoylglutathione lyase